LLVNLGTPDSTSWWDIRKYLKEFEERDGEQMVGNPFGNFITSGKIEKNNMVVFWTEFEHSINVKIRDQNEKLLYSHNFMGDNNIPKVQVLLSDLHKPTYDWDDLIFDLEVRES